VLALTSPTMNSSGFCNRIESNTVVITDHSVVVHQQNSHFQIVCVSVLKSEMLVSNAEYITKGRLVNEYVGVRQQLIGEVVPSVNFASKNWC
jgi:hypothetical protein